MTSGPIEPCPVDAVAGVLAAFAKAPLVALGEAHWLAEQANFVSGLIGHPAFPAVAGDIVVEFGHARYQDLADAFAAESRSTAAPCLASGSMPAGRGTRSPRPFIASSFTPCGQSMPPARRASASGCCWVTHPIGTCAAALRTPGGFATRGTPTSPDDRTIRPGPESARPAPGGRRPFQPPLRFGS